MEKLAQLFFCETINHLVVLGRFSNRKEFTLTLKKDVESRHDPLSINP